MDQRPPRVVLAVMLLASVSLNFAARAPSLRSLLTPAELTRTSGQETRDAYSESVDVRLVDLDVVVRDRRGAYVDGLTASDFEIKEDGQPRPIRSFTAAATGTERNQVNVVGAGANREGGVTRDGGVARNGERAEEQTTVVLFLDHVALTPTRQTLIVKRLKRMFLSAVGGASVEQIELFGKNIRFAAVTNAVPLSFAIPPISNLAAFAEQFDALPIPPATSVRAQLDHRRAAERIGGDRIGGACSYQHEARIRSELVQYIADVVRRNDKSSRGLAALVAILGGIEGRKIIFYVGGYYELDPGLEMIVRAERACPNKRFTSYSAGGSFARELAEIASQANTNRVTIYTFDSEGSRIDNDIGSDSTQNPGVQIRIAQSSNVQGALLFIARETGGRAFFNTYDPTWGMERVSTDLRNTYSIAFEPAPKSENGSARKIKVSLVGPQFRGYEVSYRRAILTNSLDERLAAKLFAALWMGEYSNILSISAEQAPQDASESAFEVLIRIPYSNLVLDETNVTPEIRLFMMARNPKSGARTQPRHEFRSVSLEELSRASADGVFEFLVGMDLPEGTYDVAVGVRDELTSRTSVVVIQATASKK